MEEVVSGYDFNQVIETSTEELIGIENQMEIKGIMTIEEMGRFIEDWHNSKLFKISQKQHKLFSQDEELKFIDSLLDDAIINKLLAHEGYRPCMRTFLPSSFLRAEILKAVKYPEISYRKYCSEEYMGQARKLNRVFLGFPLNQKYIFSHVQMSQFRSGLTFRQMANLMVYTLYHFQQMGMFGGRELHFVDSTELSSDSHRLLASLEIKGQKIRIYTDIDADCGKRRNKRDKSVYVVGYRMHTLTAIHPQTGHSYPLISLLAPANHHDSNFHLPLVQLGQAIGLNIQLVTADEAYDDNDGTFFEKTGVHLITPPKTKATLVPENVDVETRKVWLDDMCEIPMQRVGCEGRMHEYKCAAMPGDCFRDADCPKYRHIPMDSGHFQRIPYDDEHVLTAIELRKNGERPFNLMKKREGLDTVRIRSRHAILAFCTFANMVTLMLEMAGTRKKQKVKQNKQLPLSVCA